MKKRDISKYYLLVFIFILLLLAFLIIKPFVKDVLAAIVISYLFYPVYKKLNLKLNRTLSALLVCILVIVLVALPLIFVVSTVYNEAFEIYNQYKLNPPLESISITCGQKEGNICRTINNARGFISNSVVKDIYEGSMQKIPLGIISSISKKILGIPRFILDIFLVIFMTYYLLKDGAILYQKVIRTLPVKQQHQEILFKRFSDVTYAVVYGHMIVALIQGIIGTIGFIILKVPSPILLGSVMTITSLIPYLGSGVVWLPASLFMILSGLVQQDTSIATRGIILLFYGALIISTIDNIIRPKIIGARGDIHPVVSLLGVLGGLKLFGIVGIVIGPVILALSTVIIELYLAKTKI